MNSEITKVLPKNWLPTKYWEELLRETYEIRMNVKIAHIDPIPLGNQEFINHKTIKEDKTHRTIIRGSDPAPVMLKREKYQEDFEKTTETVARILGDEKLLKEIQDIKEQSRELRESLKQNFKAAAPVGEKFDYHSYITIERHDNEDAAKQVLENQCLMPKKGPLDVPIAGVTMPGVSGKTTLRELFKNDMMKQYMTEEQMKEIENVSVKAEKDFPKDIEIQKGKYQGYDVVYVTGKNMRRPSLAYLKESKDKNKIFNSVRVGRFVISGPLLQMCNSLLLGSTPCDSLTKFKTKTTVEKIGGETFVTKEVAPVKSTIAKEHYCYKEEVDEIFNSIFSILKGR